ncbi:hypothetical protein GG344DRAFT_64776 [Lentinula edodes]|nr:hypothetical protein GG344DRAFT_64776 [Lentinula edodes]
MPRAMPSSSLNGSTRIGPQWEPMPLPSDSTHTDRTGYSDKDLQDQFYNHPADRVKDGLVFTTPFTGTLQELIEAAINANAKEHRKADGHHERDICQHCGFNGHVEAVCHCKFLGLPGRKATTISATSIPDTTPSAATPNLAALLKELAANQQVLAGRIAKLHKNF